MREIIEAVRYSAVSARYKVYIIDEVHMLSKNAFNALLKTLEEPPAHVKFLFATTEVNKVPITVLSRCQRFDLRRIPADKLVEHFAHVAKAEGVEAEPEALALIARAAEGSARDGLSILDQAIAHGAGGITAAQVRDMLGLSDRGAVRRLFALLLAGDAPGVLAEVSEQYALGVDPAAMLRGLLETAHGVTRAKVGGPVDPARSAEEIAALDDWASRLGFAPLHRIWQLLLKGLEEVERAAMPLEAAEMALLRIVHASQLPDPGELARRLTSGETIAAPAAPTVDRAPENRTPTATRPPSFRALIDLIEAKGRAHLAQQLHDFVGLVAYAPPRLAIRLVKPVPGDFVRDLAAALKAATGEQWEVVASDAPAEPTLLEQEQMAEEALRQAALATPVVAAAMAAFPDAELIGYPKSATRSQ